MSTHYGVYLARCVDSSAASVQLLIPQLFGDIQIPITDWVGSQPVSQTFGFVSFLGGDPAYPVWLGERIRLPGSI